MKRKYVLDETDIKRAIIHWTEAGFPLVDDTNRSVHITIEREVYEPGFRAAIIEAEVEE